MITFSQILSWTQIRPLIIIVIASITLISCTPEQTAKIKEGIEPPKPPLFETFLYTKNSVISTRDAIQGTCKGLDINYLYSNSGSLFLYIFNDKVYFEFGLQMRIQTIGPLEILYNGVSIPSAKEKDGNDLGYYSMDSEGRLVTLFFDFQSDLGTNGDLEIRQYSMNKDHPPAILYLKLYDPLNVAFNSQFSVPDTKVIENHRFNLIWYVPGAEYVLINGEGFDDQDRLLNKDVGLLDAPALPYSESSKTYEYELTAVICGQSFWFEPVKVTVIRDPNRILPGGLTMEVQVCSNDRNVQLKSVGVISVTFTGHATEEAVGEGNRDFEVTAHDGGQKYCFNWTASKANLVAGEWDIEISIQGPLSPPPPISLLQCTVQIKEQVQGSLFVSLDTGDCD